MNQEDVFRLFVECINYGKEIIAQGDEWRLPGLGKFYLTDLPPRTQTADGRMVRDLNAHPRQKIKCKFSAFKSATQAVTDEREDEED